MSDTKVLELNCRGSATAFEAKRLEQSRPDSRQVENEPVGAATATVATFATEGVKKTSKGER